MKDPYQTLGVPRTATADQIRDAYRKLAKQHHPDLHPGKKSAEDRFKEISGAYALLSDAEKRGRFDRGEIDASGAERQTARGFYRDFGSDPAGTKYRRSHGVDPEDLEDLLAQAFGAGRDRGGGRARGQDLHYELAVSFVEAANGGVRRVTVPDGRTLDIRIPPGVRDGQVLRLAGQGAPGLGAGSKAGDALIAITVHAHPVFTREGNDILLTLPVTLQEAVLGARIPVPTLAGKVTLTVPPNSTGATRLRLKGRGIAGGDQYVQLSVVLPSEAEPELAAFLAGWKPRHPIDPRKGVIDA